MSNPWDVPPFPKRGDLTENTTYIGSGKVLSWWEGLEFNLAQLYSVFVDDPDSQQALRRYGTGRIFRDRLADLSLAANFFFIKNPNQAAEGLYQQFVTHLIGFADRRNDVAHGIVFPVRRLALITKHFDPKYRGKDQWALIPPYHTVRHHDAAGAPLYAYTRPELEQLAARLIEMNVRVSRFRKGLLRSHLPKPPKARPSPSRGK